VPNSIRLLTGLIALALAIGAHAYLYHRLVHSVTERRWARLLALSGLFLLTAGGVAARVLFRGEPDMWAMAIAFPLWLGFFLYALMAVVTVDVARVVFDRRKTQVPHSPERRQFMARAAAATAAVTGGGLAGYGVFRAYHPAEVTELPVRLPGLPKALEGFTIVQLTDIHVGSVLQRAFVDDLVARANSARGDLVAITGDLVDGTPSQLGEYVGRLRNLQSKHGTYFVTGNHDYFSGADAWVKHLEGMGVNVLRNRRVSIGDGAHSFDLLGVDDWGGMGWHNGYDLDAAAAGRDKTRASVLLAHQPSGLDLASKEGIGLQLSGHTHGGQLFPGNFVAQLMWGSRSAGFSQQGNSLLYVSRGCGFVGPPMRVGAAPEIVKVVLLPA
jgi:uncharacterized protein